MKKAIKPLTTGDRIRAYSITRSSGDMGTVIEVSGDLVYYKSDDDGLTKQMHIKATRRLRKKPKPEGAQHPPRVWIDLMMYAEGGSTYRAYATPYGQSPEYLSLSENEEATSQAAAEARAEAFLNAAEEVVSWIELLDKAHKENRYTNQKEADREHGNQRRLLQVIVSKLTKKSIAARTPEGGKEE